MPGSENKAVSEIAIEIARKLEEMAESLNRSREIMDSEEAAEFLRLSYPKFKAMAPTLPRHKITKRRIVYCRTELLKWVLEQPPY